MRSRIPSSYVEIVVSLFPPWDSPARTYVNPTRVSILKTTFTIEFGFAQSKLYVSTLLSVSLGLNLGVDSFLEPEIRLIGPPE